MNTDILRVLKPEPFVWIQPIAYFFLLLGFGLKDLNCSPVIFKKNNRKFFEKSLEHSSDLYKVKQIAARMNYWLSWDKWFWF